MNYIYCFENKINHHKYVGQTNNLSVRYSAHKSQSYNPNSKDYGCLFHQKIRQYGLENFEFYSLEEIETNDQDYIDSREQYWIATLNTWCRYGQRYNQNTGGRQYRKSLPLSDEEIEQIKYLIKNTDTEFTKIANSFNSYRDCISKINQGIYGFDENENYPLRITRDWHEIPQETKQAIANEILNSKLYFKEIAKKYNVSEHLVTQINSGESNLIGNYNYPLRKTNKRLTAEQEQLIKKLLLENKSVKDIADIVGASKSSIEKRKKIYNI